VSALGAQAVLAWTPIGSWSPFGEAGGLGSEFWVHGSQCGGRGWGTQSSVLSTRQSVRGAGNGSMAQGVKAGTGNLFQKKRERVFCLYLLSYTLVKWVGGHVQPLLLFETHVLFAPLAYHGCQAPHECESPVNNGCKMADSGQKGARIAGFGAGFQ
jgi:hypothetical protein